MDDELKYQQLKEWLIQNEGFIHPSIIEST